MKKGKRLLLVGFMILLVLLLLPIKHEYKDGGSVSYDAVLYQVMVYHALAGDKNHPNVFTVGTTVKIFGIEIFNNLTNQATHYDD